MKISKKEIPEFFMAAGYLILGIMLPITILLWELSITGSETEWIQPYYTYTIWVGIGSFLGGMITKMIGRLWRVK